MTQAAIAPAVPSAELMSQRAARRLRGALAENRISHVALAAAMGVPQQTLSRKVNGRTAFTIDDLVQVADLLGIKLEAILGVGDYADQGIGWCAIRDSNPEPADSAPRLTLYVGARVWGDFATVPAVPLVRNARHLALVDSVGGAA